jgi:hypothetical protein
LQIGSIGNVTTLVYLWLAVLGAEFAFLFSHPARAILAVASLVMASTAFFSGILSSGEREDRSNRWIFLPFLVIGFLSSFLPAYAERQGWWGSIYALLPSCELEPLRCGPLRSNCK